MLIKSGSTIPSVRDIIVQLKAMIVLDQQFLDQVEARMHQMVEADLPINKKSVNTDDAIATFARYGMHDKEKLFAIPHGFQSKYLQH